MNDTTKTARPLPTADEVRALLDYDAAAGIFRWRDAPCTHILAGAVAGNCDMKGYTRISINGRQHKAHRLAWLYVTGAWPEHQIDHIDGQRSNNAISNLRSVTSFQNCHNRAKQRSPASSRYIGVSWERIRRRWKAQIGLGGKQRYLGLFDTQEEAYSAYLAAKAQLHTTQPVPRANAYDR
jgi:hypothetical protein